MEGDLIGLFDLLGRLELIIGVDNVLVIAISDMVLFLDSDITAVGLTSNRLISITAVISSIVVSLFLPSRLEISF